MSESSYGTVLLVDGFVYGEGPRWHDDRLWFTDGFSGQVLVVEDGVLPRRLTFRRPLGWGGCPTGPSS